MSYAKGDAEILLALNEYRYLQSSQLSWLLSRSAQVTRRRCRELISLGYVTGIERTPFNERVFALGSKGFEWVAAEIGRKGNLPFSKKAARIETPFLAHALLSNDCRISFSLATREHPHVALLRSVGESEMAAPDEREPWKKYVLYERLTYEANGKKKHTSFRPDAAVFLYPRSQGPRHLGAFYIEADRNTESVSARIAEKFTGYRLYYDRELYSRLFGASVMRVLFVLDNGNFGRRARTMQSLLQATAENLGDPNPVEGEGSPADFVHMFRFADARVLTDKNIIDEPVFQDWRGNPISLYRRTANA
ncbi:MAG: replication-relaxation family protein [Deltaproteobacteria bacterium]|nr:replication-relaxation family protein [Deltaproteobacteria bacterium]